MIETRPASRVIGATQLPSKESGGNCRWRRWWLVLVPVSIWRTPIVWAAVTKGKVPSGTLSTIASYSRLFGDLHSFDQEPISDETQFLIHLSRCKSLLSYYTSSEATQFMTDLFLLPEKSVLSAFVIKSLNLNTFYFVSGLAHLDSSYICYVFPRRKGIEMFLHFSHLEQIFPIREMRADKASRG